MRKIFTKTFLGVCLLSLLLTGGMLRAQISLTATAGTLAGTYTDLTSTFAAINAGTHQGAIVINVNASYTEPAAAVLNSNGAGAALYTSVLIRPSVDGVVISCATLTGRGIIELNGADNVTIEGDNPNSVGTNRNLTITNTAANTVTFTSVIRLALSTLVSTGDNVIIRNCNLNGSATGRNVAAAISTTGTEYTTFGIQAGGGASTTTATTAPTAVSSITTTVASPATGLNLVISNNAITNVGRGVAVSGSSATVFAGLQVANNVIGNATIGAVDGVYSAGISLSGSNNAIISGNTIRVEGFMETSANIGAIVIGVTSTNTTGATIEKNNIERVINNDQTTWPAFGINLGGGNNHIVRTNMIGNCLPNQVAGTGALSTTFGSFGIRIGTGTGHQVYQNSVHFTGAIPGSTSTLLVTCLGIVSTGSTGMDIRNNIFSNQLSGGNTTLYNTVATCMYLPTGGTSSMNLNLNNNAYYQGAAATNGIAQLGTTGSAANLYLSSNFAAGSTAPATNLRSYTSTLSAAGTNDNASYASTNAPPFISATNLHLNLASGELVNVEQKGVAGLTGVATDIDGDVRPSLGTTLPDMGADEVLVASCTAANGGTITPSSAARCAGQTYSMTSVGATTGTGITYQWKVGAASGGPYVNVVGGSGATTTSYTTPALVAGTYYFVMQTTCAAGPLTGLSNQVTVTVTALPTVAVSPTAATYCLPGAAPISLTATGAISYAWSPAAGLSGTTGATVTSTPTASTTYIVTGTDAVGCTNTANTTITVSPAVVASATATPGSICPNGNSVLNSVATVANNTYCQPTTGCTFPDIITNVTFSTINRTSTCDGASSGGYSFYGTPNPTLVANNPYSLSVSTGGDVEGAAVWIDFNQDGLFAANEQLLNGFANTNPATYTNATAMIPATAYNGTTRMRVRCIYNNNPNTLLNPPCTDVTFGETEDYAVTITGGVAPLTYAWSPATFLSGTNTATVNATAVTTTTNYLATITTGDGCQDTASLRLFVATSATVVPTVSSPLCVGLPVLANANATGGLPITYTWSPNVGSTSTVHVDSTLGAHTYTVTVADACGNTANATLNYTINANPIVSATPDSSAICGGIGAPVTLTGIGATTYDWSPATGLSATTGTTVDATPTSTRSYTVVGTDANGCKDTTSVFVGVGDAMNITAVSSANNICGGDSVTLMLTGGLPMGAYCQPTYTNGTGLGDYISSVVLGNINNTTVGAAAPYYTYYPPSPTTTTTLTANLPYTITLVAGTFTANDFAVFIDYNQNGLLDDAGEKIGETDNLGAGPAQTSISFMVPSYAYNGTARLRVREMDHSTTNDIDPCTTQSSFGEVEDYDIIIQGGLDRITYAWDPSPSLTVLDNDTVTTSGITTTTTFSATATSGIGCQDTATVTVMLSTAPPTAVCTSSPITLALDANGQATLATSAVDNGSSDACGIASLVMTQGSFSCSDIGTQTSTLVVSNVNGLTDSCSVSVTIVDNMAPTITCPPNVTIPSNLCSGGAIAAWTLPTVIENCTPIITSSDAPGDTIPFGSTTVIYTVADSSGQQDTCSFVVTVTFNVMNAAPTATPNAICQGSSAVLNSGVTGGVAPLTYQWSNGGGTTSPTTVSPAATTTYQLTITDACGVTANGSVTVTVNPLPVASFTAVDNQNGTVTFTNSSSNATSYNWNFNPGTGTQSGASFNFTYGTPGTHTVTLIAHNACGNDTVTATVNVTTAVGRNLGDLNTSVYPNPNRGEFFLQLDNMTGEHVKVSITDMRGVEVKATELDITTGTHREALDISQFSKGVYFVRVRTENGSKVHKITVQ